MKTIFKSLFLLLFSGLSSTALADSLATMKCEGENIVFIEKSPYLGENSKFVQHLYILSKKEEVDQAEHTAYFLDPKLVIEDVGKYGMRHFKKVKNKVGGEFTLILGPDEDKSDGNNTRYESKGKIIYSHGDTLKGEDTITCVTD